MCGGLRCERQWDLLALPRGGFSPQLLAVRPPTGLNIASSLNTARRDASADVECPRGRPVNFWVYYSLRDPPRASPSTSCITALRDASAAFNCSRALMVDLQF